MHMNPTRAFLMRHLLTRLLVAGGIALAVVVPARLHAQVQVTRSIASDGAQRAIAAAAAEARKQGWAVSIAVVDPAGELVAFLRMDGAAFSSVDVSRAKARTAARFRRPTKALDSALTNGRLALLGVEGLTPLEGGVPIVINGETVGAVGVSGVTSAQDAQVARAGADAVKP
jgi:uncharacterized protein GlcG (DUF336 family)